MRTKSKPLRTPDEPPESNVTNIADPFTGVLFTRLGILEVAEVKVTPFLAAKWLQCNNNYRELNESRARVLSHNMAEGWHVNGESIKFQWDDDRGWELVDGQTRLRACLLAKIPFTSLVVRGVESDREIDTGLSRKFADLLHSEGYKNVLALAAAVRLLWRYQNKKMRATGIEGVASITTLLQTFNEHHDIHVHTTRNHAVTSLLPYSSAVFLSYMFAGVAGDEVAAQFFDSLASGENLSGDDPIFILRARLLKEKDKKRHMKLPALDRLAITIKAWNFWISGQSASRDRIRWRASGTEAEPFPTIKGPEEA